MNMQRFIESRYFDAAKLTSALAFCGRVQDSAITSFVQKHESGRVLCAKYFYTIHLSLQRKDVKYELRSVDIAFLDNSRVATPFAKRILKSLGTIPLPDRAKKYGMVNPEYSSVFSIVHMFKESGYHYLFIPIVIDYNIDTGLVHQCALIINLHQWVFLFYEPYGVYSKYSADYSGVVNDFLNLYDWPQSYTYSTWHQYFNLPTGIQSIMLRCHNNMRAEYDTDIAKYMANLQATNPDKYAELVKTLSSKKNLPVHKDDYTFDTLDIVHQYMSQQRGGCEVEAFYLYYKYNSKTCVTITIVELDYFFSIVANMELDAQKSNLKAFYAEFEARLNDKLFEQLLKFIDQCYTRLSRSLHLPLRAICWWT